MTIPYAPFDTAFGEDVVVDGAPGRAIVHLATVLKYGDLKFDEVMLEVSANSTMAEGSEVAVRHKIYDVTLRIDDSDTGWHRFIAAER